MKARQCTHLHPPSNPFLLLFNWWRMWGMFVERKGTVKPSFSYNFLIIYGLTVRHFLLFHPPIIPNIFIRYRWRMVRKWVRITPPGSRLISYIYFWWARKSPMKGKGTDGTKFWNEPTWRCHQNPFIGALGIINLLSLASHKWRLNRSQARQQDNSSSTPTFSQIKDNEIWLREGWEIEELFFPFIGLAFC